MKTTLIKIGRFHLWTSGSQIDPHAHLWVDCKPYSNGYSPIKLDYTGFYWDLKVWKNASGKWIWTPINRTPGFLKKILRLRQEYIWMDDRPRTLWNFVKMKVQEFVSSIYCRVYGHDVEDDSHGGPESGCMAGHCNRCGWSFHETLY